MQSSKLIVDGKTGASNGWRRVKFGDVVRFVKEDADPDSGEFERYVAGEHIETDNLRIRKWGTVGDGYLGPAFHRQFKKGQVLYGSRRTYLRKIAVAEFDGITSNTTFVLEPSGDDLIPELLPFVMQTETFTQHSIRQSKGSVNPYINFKDIAWFEFAIPPKEEQRRMAEILWAAEREKESLVHVLDRVETAKQTAFFGLVKPKMGAAGCALGDVIDDIVAGKSPVCGSEPARNGMYGVLKVSAAGYDGYHDDENKELLDPKDFQSEFEVQPGNFLVTRANALRSGVGRACIVEKTRRGLMLSDKTLKLLPKSSCITPRVLLECMRLPDCRRYIESAANGTDAKNISQGKLRLAPMPKLQKHDLMELDDLLLHFDQVKAVAQDKLAISRELIRSLIQNLLSAP